MSQLNTLAGFAQPTVVIGDTRHCETVFLAINLALRQQPWCYWSRTDLCIAIGQPLGHSPILTGGSGAGRTRLATSKLVPHLRYLGLGDEPVFQPNGKGHARRRGIGANSNPGRHTFVAHKSGVVGLLRCRHQLFHSDDFSNTFQHWWDVLWLVSPVWDKRVAGFGSLWGARHQGFCGGAAAAGAHA
jgi:hypothetical protein